MRTRFPAAAVGLVALVTGGAVAGCAPAAEPATARSPSVAEIPASAEGGACYLLDFGEIEAAIGVRFDVAAATRSKNTFTCVVQPALDAGTHLSLSVSATTADISVMKDVVEPEGAHSVSGLGKWGYQTIVKAARGDGPRIEVGWLSGDGHLLILRLTTAAGTSAVAADAAAPKVVALAKKIDVSRV